MAKNKQIDDQLEHEVQPLIEVFKRRREDATFANRVRALLTSLREAEQALSKATEWLDTLDFDELYQYQITPLSLKPASENNRGHSVRLNVLRSGLKDFATLIELETSVKLKRKRGEHGREYIHETLYFIGVYERVTGLMVPFAKGWQKCERTGEEQPLQHSTEFLRRCLNRIGESVDASRAITCINNALRERKRIDRALSELTDIGDAWDRMSNIRILD